MREFPWQRSLPTQAAATAAVAATEEEGEGTDDQPHLHGVKDCQQETFFCTFKVSDYQDICQGKKIK